MKSNLDPQTKALHDYVNSMANPNLLPASWNLNDTIANWEGVIMVDGWVTEVTLTERNVQGSIPPSFENLTQLTRLDLTGTGLTGGIPTELGTLTQLTELRLGTNQLSGGLPPSLNDLTQLEELVLSHNTLNQTIPALDQLTQLRTLDLEGNTLTGEIPASIGALDSLRTLKLGNNQLSGSIPGGALTELKQLQVLDLHSNLLTDTIPPLLAVDPPLPINIHLKEVNLSDNQLIGDVPTFFQLAFVLEKLYLNDNRLSYLPDLTGHFNADSLDLQVAGNQLPLADIAYNLTGTDEHPFRKLRYADQQEGVDTVDIVGQTFTLGRDVALWADVKEHPEHTYQWQTKDGGNWVNIDGATERLLVITKATQEDAQKQYRVVVGNGYATQANARSARLDPAGKDYQRYVRTFTPRYGIPAADVDGITLEGTSSDNVRVTTDYIDGMGRSVQTVARGAGSTSSQDIVQFTEYDALGRPYKSYLPYATDDAPGTYRSGAVQAQAQFYQQNNNQVVNDNYPFSETRYEASPLSRVLEQGAPGVDWQPGNHTVRQEYTINGVLDDVPRLRVDSNGSVVQQDNYAMGTLRKSKTTDENGHFVEEFSNREGELVLKQVQGPGGNLETYAIHDDYGRLRLVVPPQAVVALAGDWTQLNNADFRAKWLFVYDYDDYGRRQAEHVPGGGTTKTIYDRWGRLVYSQNAAMREANANQWTFTKYDYLDRPVMSGVFTAFVDEATLRQQVLTTVDRYESATTAGTIGYTLGNSHPKSITESTLRTVSYYDRYDFPHADDSDMVFVDEFTNRARQTNMKGEITGSLTRNLANQAWLRSVIYYDEQYRPMVAITDNHLGGTDRTTTRYERSVLNEVVETITRHTTASDNHTIRQAYDYDHRSRPTVITHKVDSQATVTLAAHTYNALGQLVQKQLNANAPADQASQAIDYRYHIRGWLSSINDLSDADAYYSQLLNYQTGGQYNGNIARVAWKNQGQSAKSYDYSYGPADRLTGASYQQQVSGSWTTGNFSVEGITYDGNGNLKTLRRMGEAGGTATTLDDLQYGYVGNHLASVQEQAGGHTGLGFADGATTTDEYGYDAAGNLVRDDNKGITSITYDAVLNLPTEVAMTTGTLRYAYDAAGIKLSQTVLDGAGNPIKTTHYVGAFEYEGDQLSLVHHSEGRVYYNPADNHTAYHFDLKDHLGNVRVTFSNVPVVLRQVLTMEDERAPEEERLFEGVAEHRQTLAFHNTTAASSSSPRPNKVATLLPGQQGIGKSLRVQSGDAVHLEVKARYETLPTRVKGLEGVATEVARVAQGAATGLETGGAVESLNGAALGSALATGKEAKPKAYLNYLVFDENYQLIDQGFQPVSEAAAVGQDNPDAVPETLSLDVSIEQAGYVYTYLSNEAGANRPVYFDDFSVQHASHIVQVQDYYPFGATHQQEGYIGAHNKYQYQGKEYVADLGLDLMEFGSRQLDPYLGRWTSVDPKADIMAYNSPYVAMMNNPVYYTDPDGECPVCVVAAFAIIGAYTGGTMANGSFNPTQWDYQSTETWLGIGMGAVIGAATGGMVNAGVGSAFIGYSGAAGKFGVTIPFATLKTGGLIGGGLAAGGTGLAFAWETAAGGSGSLNPSNPISGGNLLAGSNAQQSVYTGGYAQTTFNDRIQDRMTERFLASQGMRVLPGMDAYANQGGGSLRASSMYGSSYYSGLSGYTFLEGTAWGTGTVSGAYGLYGELSKRYFHTSAPAVRALNVVGRVSGAYSLYSHGSQAVTEYQRNGLSQQFYIDAGRTAVDAALFLYRGSNPIILGGSVLYSVGDAYYDTHFRNRR